MATISLCMIVRDEESVLERCLASAQPVADEICVVDTGSTDRTPDIARQFGAKLQEQVWQDDFSAARNASFAMASCDYVLWMDADDVLLPEDQERFLALKEQLTADVVMLPYRILPDADGVPQLCFYRERLLRRTMGFQWEGAVHECITPRGVVVYGEAAVTHLGKEPDSAESQQPSGNSRNLRIYQKLLAEGHHFSAREDYYYGRELADHGAYRAAIPVFERFLKREEGALHDRIGALLRMADCFYATGQPEAGLEAVLRCLMYGAPNAEICCRIGGHYLAGQRYADALFWYHMALQTPKTKDLRFYHPDYEAFLPYLQLCVCYDRLGATEWAIYYHRLAYAIHPGNPFCEQNQRYYEKHQQAP